MRKTTFESEERQKTGILVERSVFEEDYKDQPDVLKKAVFKARRVKEDGKWVTKDFTKIYGQRKGIYNFVEKEGESIEHEKDIDMGDIQMTEDQQTKTYELMTGADFADHASRRDLTSADMRQTPSSFAPPPSSVGSSSTKPSKRSVASMQSDSDNSTGDDDELSPLEKQQRGRVRPKKKAKAQPQQKPDDSSTAITTPGPLSNVPAAISRLVTEAQAGLDALRGAKTMPDINEDQLGSLHNRLTAKKNGLGKKPANNVNSLEAINPLRCKIGLITEVLKAISTFEKKKEQSACSQSGGSINNVMCT